MNMTITGGEWLVGLLIVLGGSGLLLVLWKLIKKIFKIGGSAELPKKPEPKLTEELKRKIREEIHSDSNSELAKRILDLLDSGRGRDRKGNGK